MILEPATGFAQPVTQIAGSGVTSFFLKADGSLWGMGRNTSGQLGDGTLNNTNLPELIVRSNVTAVAAGRFHTLFLKTDGSMWAMGLNNQYELGDGTTVTTNLPKMILASNVTAIAAGYQHSLFLKSDGSLWGVGRNSNGQLGNGSTTTQTTPQKIVGSNVTAIAVSGGQASYSLFIKNDGSLWGMGYNSTGELGDGTTVNSLVPKLLVASNVTAVAAGNANDSQTLFIKSDGSLWGMGFNANGQLGDGTINNALTPKQLVASNVVSVSAGDLHTMFLKTDGSLWSMGDNTYGQLGNGSKTGTNQPIRVVANGVGQIVGGAAHTLFLKTDGSLWGMGDNSFGELGLGTNISVSVPTQILGAYNRLAIQPSGGTILQLNFVGAAGSNYVLESSTGLLPANWLPEATNSANSYGALVLTNTVSSNSDRFWRMRSIP